MGGGGGGGRRAEWEGGLGGEGGGGVGGRTGGGGVGEGGAGGAVERGGGGALKAQRVIKLLCTNRWSVHRGQIAKSRATTHKVQWTYLCREWAALTITRYL